MRKQLPDNRESWILEVILRMLSLRKQDQFLDPADHAIRLHCFHVEFSCLVIYCCITYYSQRWHISLVDSYVKAIPARDDGRNYVITVICPVIYAVNYLLIEVRCLVIYRRAADLVTHNIDTFL